MDCGGPSRTEPADDNVKQICADIRSACEDHAGKKFEAFEAVEYKSQVVCGMNYYIKVKVDNDNNHAHIIVYVKLPCYGGTKHLNGFKHPHEGGNGPIEAFEHHLNLDEEESD